MKIRQRINNKHILTAIMAMALFAALMIKVPGTAFAAPRASSEESGLADNSGAIENGAFEVLEYDLSAVVNKDHSYDVTEEISVNIPEQVQDIEFAVPSGNFRISDLEVEDTAYSSKKAREASSVIIVDPNKLGKGQHKYKIKYTLREFEDRDDAKDIFYFNALLPEWKQPIGKVSVNIVFPKDFPWDDMQCYAGQFGMQDVNNRVNYESDASGKTVSVTGEKIPENFAITLKAELPDGYWEGALNGSWVILTIAEIMGGALLLLIIMWFIGGRDPRIARTPVTKPPEGILPCEMGYIFDGEVGIRDILQLLIYFGTKGYLRISEYEPKRYRIIRRSDPVSEEKLYRNAYSILFEDVYKDRYVEMEDLGDRLMRVRDAIKDDIAAGYTDAESYSFTPLSRILRVIGTVITAIGIGVSNALSYRYEYLSINYVESIAAACIFAAAVYALSAAIDRRDSGEAVDSSFVEIFSGLIIIGITIYVSLGVSRRTETPVIGLMLAIAALLSVFFVIIMRARGKANAELVTRLRSLRNFIYHPTPRELLENHIADENYYYDMLQYALAMGAEESWAISFLTLNVEEPEWYSDDIEGHAYSNLRDEMTTLDYARDIKAFMRTIEAAFHELQRRRHRR